MFSVRDMEDELKPVAMYIVTHFIWNSVRKTLKKRLLVVDEAWWMMKSDDTASFLYSIAKRGRKYFLGTCNYYSGRWRLYEKSIWSSDCDELITSAPFETVTINDRPSTKDIQPY